MRPRRLTFDGVSASTQLYHKLVRSFVLPEYNLHNMLRMIWKTNFSMMPGTGRKFHDLLTRQIPQIGTMRLQCQRLMDQ